MITSVAYERAQWLHVAIDIAVRNASARVQLAEHLDGLSVDRGDGYYHGLADGLRLGASILTAAHPQRIWN